ncbi:MAG: hypothetical protein EOP84_01670 [Verrucomicrobiaceae bacterium]|nr:MAG: hypothetical protein EOP84_01670 [Verrucomicrobiaceae bacterium]
MMFYSGHCREPKPENFDSLPYRQDSVDYVIGQDYRCKARPGWMFTYRGTDLRNDRGFRPSMVDVRFGEVPLDNWDVCSWAK